MAKMSEALLALARLRELGEKEKAHKEALKKADGEAVAMARGIAAVMLDSLLSGRTEEHDAAEWEAIEKLAVLAYHREFSKSRGKDLYVWVQDYWPEPIGRWSRSQWIAKGRLTPKPGGQGHLVCRFCRITVAENVTRFIPKGVQGKVRTVKMAHTLQCALEYLSGIRKGRITPPDPEPEDQPDSTP